MRVPRSWRSRSPCDHAVAVRPATALAPTPGPAGARTSRNTRRQNRPWRLTAGTRIIDQPDSQDMWSRDSARHRGWSDRRDARTHNADSQVAHGSESDCHRAPRLRSPGNRCCTRYHRTRLHESEPRSMWATIDSPAPMAPVVKITRSANSIVVTASSLGLPGCGAVKASKPKTV